MRSLALFLFLLNSVYSQTLLKGRIIHASGKEPIPYASIGVPAKGYGAICDELGNYELKTELLLESDTLRVSAIGFLSKFIPLAEIRKYKSGIIDLLPATVQLTEVNIKADKIKRKKLGCKSFSKNNCTAFIGERANWKGEQAAIKITNTVEKTLWIEEFNFYIIKNLYEDSLVFRLMLYPVNKSGYPGPTFLQKPIIFKTKVKQGVVTVDLKSYNINYDKDFFVSLECLMNEMESGKFCFAGSIDTPSFAKTSPFGKWFAVRRGGADFNVGVTYMK